MKRLTYDISIGKTREEAENNVPLLSLDKNEHNSIFLAQDELTKNIQCSIQWNILTVKLYTI